MQNENVKSVTIDQKTMLTDDYNEQAMSNAQVTV